MKRKNTPLASLTCASLLGSAALSQAAILWQQNFNGYIDGTELNTGGNTTPTGFGGSWYNGTGQITVTSGVAQGSGNSWADLGTTFSTTVGATATLWVAFDWGHDSTNTGGTYGGLTFFDAGGQKFLIGNTYDAAYWGMDGATDGATTVEMIGRKSAATRITLGAGLDTVDLWVQDSAFSLDANFNPIVSGSALATATAELSDVNNLRIMGNNGQTFDNLSITSIPEPSAALLGGLGMLALLRRRR